MREKIPQSHTLLGIDMTTNKPFGISDRDRNSPTLICGSTSAGKTESAILPLLYQDAIKGKFCVVIDAKGDRDTLDKMYYYCHVLAGRPFFAFTPGAEEMTHSYNPLYSCFGSRFLTADSMADILFETYNPSNKNTDTSDFYKKEQQKDCRNAFRLLDSINKPFSMQDLCALMSNETIFAELRSKAPTHEGRMAAAEMEVARQDKRFRDIMLGLVTYLKMFDSWHLNSYNPDIRLESFYFGTKNANGECMRPIVYFCLPVNISPNYMKGIGKIVTAVIMALAGYIGNADLEERQQCSIFIDEFQALANRTFADILARIRSSKFSLTLATQGLSDLEVVDRAFLRQVIKNTQNKILMAGKDPDDAELFSRIIAEVQQEDRSVQFDEAEFGGEEITGQGNLRLKQQRKVDPSLFMNLRTGQAVYIGPQYMFLPPYLQMPFLPDPPKNWDHQYKKLPVRKPKARQGMFLTQRYQRLLMENLT